MLFAHIFMRSKLKPIDSTWNAINVERNLNNYSSVSSVLFFIIVFPERKKISNRVLEL